MVSFASLVQLRKPSLRLVLVVPFVLQVALVVGLTGWISLRNGQKAVNDLASQIRTQVAQQINDELKTYLEQAMLVNRINVNAIATEMIDLKRLSSLEDYLRQQLKEFNTLNSVVIGTEKPDYIGLGYNDQDRSLLYFSAWNPKAKGTLDWQIDAKGNRSFLEKDISYDHRTRSWYQAAVQAKRPIWSSIDVSVTPENLILSASHPFYDTQGNLLGVVSSDLGLGQISQFLSSLKIGKTGQAFIIERDGLLVATSTHELPYRVKQRSSDLARTQSLERIQASESKNVLIHKTAQYLRHQWPNLRQLQQPQQLHLEINGERILIGITPFHDARGLDWLILTAIPEADFMETINANTRLTIALCVVALGLTVMVSILLAHWLIQPILNVVDQANTLSLGQWDTQLSEPLSRELTLLTCAFRRMAQQLQTSFASLQYRASHDELTGLLNQSAFRSKLQQTIQEYDIAAARVGADPSTFAVLFLDLNDFKLINDSLGHLVGDRLLQTVAQCLLTCLRATDTVARFGSDEFLVLLSPLPEKTVAIDITERILDRFQAVFQVDSNGLFTSVSVGIAYYDQYSTQVEELIRNADIALYRAKVNPQASYEVFNQDMHAQVVQQLQLAIDLKHAIDRQELILYYQPIIDAHQLQVMGFEVLVRWQHPTKGLLSPSIFIPIAEETGQIVEIGGWILRQACQQMQRWQLQFGNVYPMTVSVNVASKQFLQADFLAQVYEILMKTGLPPSCLKLEITETSLLKNKATILRKLNVLKASGVQISIDDFGIGYSSLSYLAQFPIDTLKIDRFFTQCLGTIDRSGEITEVICLLAKKLNLTVIAEGVETAEQLEKVQLMGCDYVQGYYFAPPLSVQEAELWLSGQGLARR